MCDSFPCYARADVPPYQYTRPELHCMCLSIEPSDHIVGFVDGPSGMHGLYLHPDYFAPLGYLALSISVSLDCSLGWVLSTNRFHRYRLCCWG